MRRCVHTRSLPLQVMTMPVTVTVLTLSFDPSVSPGTHSLLAGTADGEILTFLCATASAAGANEQRSSVPLRSSPPGAGASLRSSPPGAGASLRSSPRGTVARAAAAALVRAPKGASPGHKSPAVTPRQQLLQHAQVRLFRSLSCRSDPLPSGPAPSFRRSRRST